MAIFWSSKGDRVKRLLVRRCSHSAQQRQREQLNRDADVDAAIERVKRDAIVHKGGKFGCTPIRESVITSWTFDFPASNTMPARERPGKRQSRTPPVLSFGEVALFRIFGKATSFRRSENPPSGPVEVALFRIKGKENYRLRLERFSTERRFDEAPQVR